MAHVFMQLLLLQASSLLPFLSSSPFLRYLLPLLCPGTHPLGAAWQGRCSGTNAPRCPRVSAEFYIWFRSQLRAGPRSAIIKGRERHHCKQCLCWKLHGIHGCCMSARQVYSCLQFLLSKYYNLAGHSVHDTHGSWTFGMLVDVAILVRPNMMQLNHDYCNSQTLFFRLVDSFLYKRRKKFRRSSFTNVMWKKY